MNPRLVSLWISAFLFASGPEATSTSIRRSCDWCLVMSDVKRQLHTLRCICLDSRCNTAHISCDWKKVGVFVSLSCEERLKKYENHWHFDPVVSRQCPETIRNCGMQLLQQDGCIAAAQPITSWASAPKKTVFLLGCRIFEAELLWGKRPKFQFLLRKNVWKMDQSD